MSTVAARTFRSTPFRAAPATWAQIVDLLTQGRAGEARTELLAVSGVASSVIADQAPRAAPIVVTCDGPRTRVYCVYDEDAVEGSDANESPLGFDALSGDWRVSLPCDEENLGWVQRTLKSHSSRVTARSLKDDVPSNAAASREQVLTLNPKGFLEP
ncbi:hypothetical protein MFUL124B02_36460 [Myxococcus fulvus 124B02]|nr:hypothetical protein MFUL124B02_36460 [Myxococcus fulvus 124B02]